MSQFIENLKQIQLDSKADLYTKIANFPVYSDRLHLTKFMARNEIFTKILNTHGSIAEVGVLGGSSLMSWAYFSSIYEPYNHQRKIFGFDTFSNEQYAKNPYSNARLKETITKNLLEQFIDLYDQSRPLGDVPRVFLKEGNPIETIPSFLNENPNFKISLLSLDLDIYDIAKASLDYFYKHVVKGGIILFGTLNQERTPDQSIALFESLNINSLRLKRVHIEPMYTWVEKE